MDKPTIPHVGNFSVYIKTVKSHVPVLAYLILPNCELRDNGNLPKRGPLILHGTCTDLFSLKSSVPQHKNKANYVSDRNKEKPYYCERNEAKELNENCCFRSIAVCGLISFEKHSRF